VCVIISETIMRSIEVKAFDVRLSVSRCVCVGGGLGAAQLNTDCCLVPGKEMTVTVRWYDET
jgi:hypothetical protein